MVWRPRYVAGLVAATSIALQLAPSAGHSSELEELRLELERLRAENAWLRSQGAASERLLSPFQGSYLAGHEWPSPVVGFSELEAPSTSDEEEAELEEAGEEEGEFSTVDVGCGWMLLGGVAMVMVLFYLVNWPDDDIRRFTWIIISTTLSIFTAVLVFTSISEFVMGFLLEELLGWDRHGWRLLVVDYVFFLLWFAMLQVVTFYKSGVSNVRNAITFKQTVWVVAEPLRADCGTVVPERDVRNAAGMKGIAYRDNREVFVQKKAANREKLERNAKCWGTLLAHMTGFAAINAGGQLQHIKFFSRNAPMALLAAVVNLVFLLALFKATDCLRRKGRAEEGEENACQELFFEEVQEAENDVLSLSTSFLTVQALRFALTGVLPGKDGMEEPETARGGACVLGLYGAGFAFGLGVLALLLTGDRAGRAMEVVQNTWAMIFAWCLLWATRWLALGWPLLEQVRAAPATVEGRVMLALVLSGVALLVIFALDVVEDTVEGARVVRVIQNIVNALSILVGFSWEHCFDAGVEAVAGATSSPVLVELLFTALVAGIIIPAWRRSVLSRVMYLNEEQKDIMEARRRGSSEEANPLTSRDGEEEDEAGQKCC